MALTHLAPNESFAGQSGKKWCDAHLVHHQYYGGKNAESVSLRTMGNR